MPNDKPATVRIDKWLWAARFFKTRGLASEAIKGGKVDVNGNRAKPSKSIEINDLLKIRRGPYEYVVTVTGIAERRGSASEAAGLYQETVDSVARREALAMQLKAAAAMQPTFPGRPTKRDRRAIIRFTGKG